MSKDPAREYFKNTSPFTHEFYNHMDFVDRLFELLHLTRGSRQLGKSEKLEIKALRNDWEGYKSWVQCLRGE